MEEWKEGSKQGWEKCIQHHHRAVDEADVERRVEDIGADRDARGMQGLDAKPKPA